MKYLTKTDGTIPPEKFMMKTVIFKTFTIIKLIIISKIIFNFTGIKFITINYHPLWVSIIPMGEAITKNLMTNGMMKIMPFLG